MEENLCSYSSDKGLITRIYKQPKTLNTKRTNNPVNKSENELNRQFLKEVQMTNKYMKKCSKMNQNDIDYYISMQSEWLSSRIPNSIEDVRKKNPYVLLVRM
jgi:hypothetical protein